MKNNKFLAINACAWLAVLFVSAEPIANRVTELWQAYLVFAFFALAMWLAWCSMRELERRINGKNKN